MAATASAGSSGRSASIAVCRRSTSSTIGEQQLVARPEVVEEHAVAGADRLGDLAQRPPADAARGESVDERVEQLRRRRSSGGRGIPAPQLLAARLEALRLEVEVALGEAPHEHARPTTPSGPRWSMRWRTSVRSGALRDDLVRGERRAAGRPLAPRPRDAGLDLGDLPHELRQAGLLDLEALADLDAGAVERPRSRSTDAVHSGQRSTSAKTSHTTDAGASISTLLSVIMYQMVHSREGRLQPDHRRRSRYQCSSGRRISSSGLGSSSADGLTSVITPTTDAAVSEGLGDAGQRPTRAGRRDVAR